MARLLFGSGRGIRVLIGLVFIGVSINLEKIVSEPSFGLPGRAAEALILLAAVFTASYSPTFREL